MKLTEERKRILRYLMTPGAIDCAPTAREIAIACGERLRQSDWAHGKLREMAWDRLVAKVGVAHDGARTWRITDGSARPVTAPSSLSCWRWPAARSCEGAMTVDPRIERLEAALVRAQGDIRKWASFADEFYHRRDGLADDLAAIDRVLEETAGEGSLDTSPETRFPWPLSAGNDASGRVPAPHPSNTLSSGLRSAAGNRG